MIMRVWLNRLWAEVNEMPGPVWVFGAWVVLRLVKWLFFGMAPWIAIGSVQDCASMWLGIAVFAGTIAGQGLPFAALWMLIRRKPVAVSLVSLYAGLRAVGLCFGLVTPLLTVVPEWARGPFGRWPDQLPMLIFELLLWVAFMVYLERAKDIARVFPKEQRRCTPWWLIVILVGLVAVLGF